MRIAPCFAVATLLAAGCTSGVPALAPPARIEFYRGNPIFCGQSGDPVCEARVNHVAGRPLLTLSSYAEIAPGRHVLGLFCRMNLGIMIGDAQTFQREVNVELAAGGRYRVAASAAPRACAVTLIDEATGQPVGKVR